MLEPRHPSRHHSRAGGAGHIFLSPSVSRVYYGWGKKEKGLARQPSRGFQSSACEFLGSLAAVGREGR